MRELQARLNNIGFEGTRRALAGLSLSLFVALYLLVSMQVPAGWGPAFLALAACYLVAFLAVVAEWFWGRWFAAGLGWSGIMVAAASLAMIGWSPPLAIYGGLHAVVVVALMGQKMVNRYDQQEGWRQRFGMDEFGVARLRKTVTRASMSLPSLILYALGPKEGGGESLLVGMAGIATLLAVGAGLRGLVRMRSWGWMTIGGAAAALWILNAVSTPALDFAGVSALGQLAAVPLMTPAAGLAAAALTFAVLPFLRPALRFLRG
jgi:hypothetical protein